MLLGVVTLCLTLLLLPSARAAIELGEKDSAKIDTHTGHVELEVERDPDAEDAKPLKVEHPVICEKIQNYWGPVLTAKAQTLMELKLFNTAGMLARDLEAKMEKHKKEDHSHFDCHEAKDLLSMSSARETVDLFRALLEVPVKGHTGESVEATLRDMQQSLQGAKLLSPDSYNEFEDVIKDLEKMRGQYAGIKADYDAVMTEHEDCRKNFQSFIKEVLDLTHDDIPNWEHLHFGLESLQEQCQRDEL
jgi:hypothetical protein